MPWKLVTLIADNNIAYNQGLQLNAQTAAGFGELSAPLAFGEQSYMYLVCLECIKTEPFKCSMCVFALVSDLLT